MSWLELTRLNCQPYLAVEDDGGGGGGALEDADDLVEAALVGRSVLVQRDPQRLNLFILRIQQEC